MSARLLPQLVFRSRIPDRSAQRALIPPRANHFFPVNKTAHPACPRAALRSHRLCLLCSYRLKPIAQLQLQLCSLLLRESSLRRVTRTETWLKNTNKRDSASNHEMISNVCPCRMAPEVNYKSSHSSGPFRKKTNGAAMLNYTLSFRCC